MCIRDRGYNVLSGFMPFGEGSAVLDLEDFLVSNTILPLGSLVSVSYTHLDVYKRQLHRQRAVLFECENI